MLYSKTRILHKRASIQFRACSDRLNKVCRNPWEVKLQVIVVAATTAHWDMIRSVRLVIPCAPSGADTGTVTSHIHSNWPYGSIKHKQHATFPFKLCRRRFPTSVIISKALVQRLKRARISTTASCVCGVLQIVFFWQGRCSDYWKASTTFS